MAAPPTRTLGPATRSWPSMARVTELGFDRATGAIRGAEGTTVTLRIRRGDRELDVVVVRKLVRM